MVLVYLSTSNVPETVPCSRLSSENAAQIPNEVTLGVASGAILRPSAFLLRNRHPSTRQKIDDVPAAAYRSRCQAIVHLSDSNGAPVTRQGSNARFLERR